MNDLQVKQKPTKTWLEHEPPIKSDPNLQSLDQIYGQPAVDINTESPSSSHSLQQSSSSSLSTVSVAIVLL